MGTLTSWDKTSKTPKYVGLARYLLRDIASRSLKPGHQLSSENELVKEHNVSRVTVRQALKLLQNQGYISRERARGTFVEKEVDPEEHFGMLQGTMLVICSGEQSSHCDEDIAFSTVLLSIERAFSAKGFSVQLFAVGDDLGRDRLRLESLLCRDDLEGVLSIGRCLDQYSDLMDDIPVVRSCGFYPEQLPCVGSDVRLVAHELTQHLIEQGHDSIALVCGSWIDSQALGMFADGYREAFEAIGREIDRAMIIHAHADEQLEDLARNVLTSRIRPTAVIGENWRVCEAFAGASDELGLNIPHDLSLVGYGQNVLDIPRDLRITAYVPETAKIGQQAAELLISICRGESAPSTPLSVQGRLVVRDSVRKLN